MKNYVLLALMLGLLISNDTMAQPTTEVIAPPDLELKHVSEDDASRYLPIWIIDDDSKDIAQKFIWVPSKDGHILVLEASNSAILRLAWNLDTYTHEAKTKTN